MRFKSALVQQASGSLGGSTYSHNAGGMYMRARTTPTDPNTARQVIVRNAVQTLVNRWVNILSDAQRALWNTYAENVPLDDVFGDPRYRSGINHYVRSNVTRIQGGRPIIDSGPTIFDLGEFTAPVITATQSTYMVYTAYTEADAWRSEDGAFMHLYISKPQNPTIEFFKGPFQYYTAIAGNSGTPPTSPHEAQPPQAFTEGQRLFGRSVVTRADGRLASAVIGFCDAAA